VISLRKDLHIFTSALYQTNSVIIETPKVVFVIDPCWLPSEVQMIKEFVDERIRDKYLYLIFTHSDYDHIIGYGAFPGAKVIASKGFANNTDKQKDIADAIKWDSEHYIERDYPLTYPSVGMAIDMDGKALHYSGTVLTFYLAPGHTAEGMMIIWEPAGVLIAGDYLSDIEFPFIEDSLNSYRRTMSKVDRILRAHQINWMIPGHGSIAHGPAEVELRKDQALEYINDLEQSNNTNPFPTEKYKERYKFWNDLAETHKAQLQKLTQTPNP
jgi:glyoxylase-like metal-dependent hydrolase (beta-lactamase superfamily II)